MKTKLRILALLMALVMCLSLFVGCGSKEKADDDRKDSGKKDKETVTEVEKIDPKKEPNEAVVHTQSMRISLFPFAVIGSAHQAQSG